MTKLTLYTDKNELFKYSLTLEGAKYSDTKTRLCLEFDNGENVYFKGKLNEHGFCQINIPALKNREGSGKAKVEVVAEGTFFEIYELPFEVKQKLKVGLKDVSTTNENDVFETEVIDIKPKISFKLDMVEKSDDIIIEDTNIDNEIIKEPIKKEIRKTYNKHVKEYDVPTFEEYLSDYHD